MNIFFLDYDPKKCAQYHNDKHVVKMILETAQLLCGVHWVTGNEAPYKLSHKNHPCSIWVRSSLENYLWLCELGLELCIEYEYRYGKKHKTYDVIMWCILNKPNISDVEFTTPPLAMPDHCKVNNNPIKSYRNYYMIEKSSFCKWKGRDVPNWYKT
jgi:hypothetical protein